MPKVSIIIPVYNASGYIARAVESVLNQSYQNLEIIIINDGSTDDSEAIVRRYLVDKKIKYIATKNRGVSHAINVGLREATGDYICFLHADDVFLSDKIKKQVSLMERFPRYGVSYTNESYFLEGTDRAVKSPYFHFSGDVFYFLKRANFIHMSTAMLRRKLLGTESLDESLACHEDWGLFLRLSARGAKFLYIDEVLSSISVSSKNLSSDTALMDATRRKVGKRARELWKDFKKDINLFSAKGISSLTRYVTFKIRAMMIGFPADKKFNRKGVRSEKIC